MLFNRSLFPLVVTMMVVGCDRMPDDGVRFSEVTQSQPITIEDFSDLRFSDEDGNEVQLADIMTRDYLVLVVTRGWYGGVCFYCARRPPAGHAVSTNSILMTPNLVVIFPTESNEDAPKLE